MKIFLYIASLNIFWGLDPDVYGQSSSDSLSLTQVMQTVIQSHPSIKEAEEAVAIAEAKIGYAKSGFYPTIDASVSYSRIGPVPSLDVPALGGKFQLYPADNYSAAVNYNQVLYDFGKTKKNIGLESENKALAGKNAELVKQGLSLTTAGSFFNLLYLQEAIRIKDKELQILKEHLEFVEKKKATGSATQYEYLTTKVKISATESQKLDLETALKIQQSVLKSLMGLPLASSLMVKQDLSMTSLSVPQDSLLSYSYNHRLEMDLSKEKETIADLQYNLIKSQDNAVLNIFALGGGKNGYIPNLNEVKPNFVAGASLKIPLFDGYRKKYSLLQARSAANNAASEAEIQKRKIANEVIENDANRILAIQKTNQYELQLSQAEEALSLAKVKFTTGSITNIELFDAENDVFNSQLMLLKSKVDYAVSVFKLNISLGNKMY